MTKRVKKNLVTVFACASVLSVSCALAAIKPVHANAEGLNDGDVIATGFSTDDGASVYKKSGKSGMRWTVSLSEEVFNSLATTYTSVEYGTIVGVAGADLTVESANASYKAWTTQPTAEKFVDGVYTYGAAVTYTTDSLSNPTAAYAAELQARMYAKVTDSEGTKYFYADQGDVVRSMRGVAIAAIYDGDATEALQTYVGGALNVEADTTGKTTGFVATAQAESEVALDGLMARKTSFKIVFSRWTSIRMVM